MPDLLLELRSEEIPARMQRKAAGDLKKLVTDALVDAGLTYEGAQEYWTPRRLALDIRGVTAKSADIREERKGPRTDAPEKAIQGFLRGAGLASIADATVRTDPKKGEFYVALIEKPGRVAEEIIAEALPTIIRNFPWPKSMRWGKASATPGALRWVRPLQSIVCTFGPETEEPKVIPFDVDGVTAANVTYGHRFHAPDAITVRRFDDYLEKLEKAFVVLDGERRKAIILDDAKNLAFASGLELIEDEGLLEEVSGLVEWPVVMMGEFDEDFLEIPAEVIRLTIKTNQKCFVLRKGADLANKFLLVSNIAAKDGGEMIAHGNGKVVRARLSDALYFWQTDQADLPDLEELAASAEMFGLDLARPLDQRMAKLDQLGVTFHAKLGTQGARVKRIAALADKIGSVTGADAALVRRAATLAKADLRTEAVGEFPELQGAMGQKYALLQNEDAGVAAAMEEHYKPQGPSDDVPSNPISVAVALADKIDTLTGFWAIDEKPTGSKDPYALRRAALGVIRLVLDNELALPLSDIMRMALENYRRQHGADFVADDVADDLLAFLHDRLKVYLRDQGLRHDLIDAVVRKSAPHGDKVLNDDMRDVSRRVSALSELLATEDGQNLLAGSKRAANILAAEEKKGTRISAEINTDLFELPAETELHRAVSEAGLKAQQAVENEDYSGSMRALSTLRGPVDQFFEDVHVNADDDAVRANRLALLDAVRQVTNAAAEFGRISG